MLIIHSPKSESVTTQAELEEKLTNPGNSFVATLPREPACQCDPSRHRLELTYLWSVLLDPLFDFAYEWPSLYPAGYSIPHSCCPRCGNRPGGPCVPDLAYALHDVQNLFCFLLDLGDLVRVTASSGPLHNSLIHSSLPSTPTQLLLTMAFPFPYLPRLTFPAYLPLQPLTSPHLPVFLPYLFSWIPAVTVSWCYSFWRLLWVMFLSGPLCVQASALPSDVKLRAESQFIFGSPIEISLCFFCVFLMYYIFLDKCFIKKSKVYIIIPA